MWRIAVVHGVVLIPAVVSVPETFWMEYLALVVGLILQFDLRVVQGFSKERSSPFEKKGLKQCPPGGDSGNILISERLSPV
jgi:hypothetical protein